MYAPFGTGVLVGPRRTFADGDPFLAGGGAVDLVELDEVLWTDPPEREEAGSPNVVGAVALHAAIDTLSAIGWPALIRRERHVARLLRQAWLRFPASGCRARVPRVETLPVATFTVEGVPHALVAARLAAEEGIGVRYGCFCAHP
jgi:selenocysteine lyase/cysteine desulfurase